MKNILMILSLSSSLAWSMNEDNNSPINSTNKSFEYNTSNFSISIDGNTVEIETLDWHDSKQLRNLYQELVINDAWLSEKITLWTFDLTQQALCWGMRSCPPNLAAAIASQQTQLKGNNDAISVLQIDFNDCPDAKKSILNHLI